MRAWDENSCQKPARNNWSHNGALLYVSEVMGVKQQLKTQGSENTESSEALIGSQKTNKRCVIFKTRY